MLSYVGDTFPSLVAAVKGMLLLLLCRQRLLTRNICTLGADVVHVEVVALPDKVRVKSGFRIK